MSKRSESRKRHTRERRRLRDALEGPSFIRRKQLNRIYIRDRKICYWCGEFVPREEASREHLFRPIDDYPHLARNILYMALAHKRCNR